MSREIKFRAWDKFSKVMVSPHDGDFIKWAAPTNWRECYEVMQSTGLLDKNGKEIYEGDVVNYGDYTDNSGPCNHEVTWKDGCFITKEISTNDDFTFVDPCGEVIGNIYENPELIEK